MHGAPALGPDFAHLPYVNPDAPKGGRLDLAYLGAFDSLNPYNVKALSTAQGLVGNVYQSLMMRSADEPFTLYGLIARSIETDDARDFIAFHIDPAAHFSDGGKITAADVVFSFNLLKTKGLPSQRAAYALVKRVETPDDTTVRFDLSGANDRELPLILAMMPVLSRAHTDAEHFEDQTLQIPVGSGPYRVDEVEPGQRLVLRRDPDYWARDLPITRGLYNFDEIRIDYYRDASAMFEAFKAGLNDFRLEDDPTRWLKGYDFPAARDGRVIKAAIPYGLPKGVSGFAFNTRRAVFSRRARARGAGDDVRFRMDQRQSLRRRLQALAELLRRQRTLLGRAAGFGARARAARPLPRRGARRRHGGAVGAAGLRRNGARPDAGAPRPRAAGARRLLFARRRVVERARRAARLRDPRQDAPGGAPRARLCAKPRAHRDRGERAPRRRSAVPAPPRAVRLRHDDRLVDRLALAGQRAARPLELAGGDDGGLVQHLRRRLAGDRRDDRGRRRRARPRRFRRRGARARPTAAVGLLYRAAVLRAGPMDRLFLGARRPEKTPMFGVNIESWWRAAP